MINKSKVKLFQKYYRMNPREYLEILDKWKTKSERQDKIIKNLLSIINLIDISELGTKAENTIKTAEKEVAKIGVFE